MELLTEQEFNYYETNRIKLLTEKQDTSNTIPITPELNQALEQLKTVLTGGQIPQQVLDQSAAQQPIIEPVDNAAPKKKPSKFKNFLRGALPTAGSIFGGTLAGATGVGMLGTMAGGALGGALARKIKDSTTNIFDNILRESNNE
jgi:hypothetical protein